VKLKVIKNIVTSKVARQVLTVRKHSPALLFGAGVVGIIGTVVLASRATLKLEEVIEDAKEDLEKVSLMDNVNYSEQDRRNDTVIIYARTAGEITRLYAPAIVLGGLSIAALTGSHVILTRRNLAVTAAYAALDRGFREYRQRVVNALGIDKDREFRYDMQDREIVEETDKGPKTRMIKQPGVNGASIYARFFDESNPNWNRAQSYNQVFINCQQSYANDLLRARGHVFLNDVYDMLGIPRSREGAIVGWLWDGCETEGDGYIDFGVFEGDGYSGMQFVVGNIHSTLLDFNVDGIIYDKI
jgi:uncharacterized protein DUF6353